MNTAQRLAANLYRQSFKAYYYAFTPPEYKRTWWRDYACDTVQAFLADPKKRYLFVNVPTQHGKSQMFSQKLAEWVLGNAPDVRIMGLSYSDALAKRNCAVAFNIMKTERFYNVFGVTVGEPSEIKEAKKQDYFQVNGRKGYYYAVPAGGQVTGWSADLIIYDDPHGSQSELDSQALQTRVRSNFDAAVLTRMRKDTKVIFVCSRMGGNDLQNYALTKLVEGGENPLEVCEFVIFPFFKDSEPARELVTIGETEHLIETGAKSYAKDIRAVGEQLDTAGNTDNALSMKAGVRAVYNSLFQQNPSLNNGGAGEWFTAYSPQIIAEKVPVLAQNFQLSLDFNVRGYTCIVSQGSPYNKANKGSANHYRNIIETITVGVNEGGLQRICEMVTANYNGYYEVTGDSNGYNRLTVPVEIAGKVCATPYDVIAQYLRTCRIVAPKEKLSYKDSMTLCARVMQSVKFNVWRAKNTALINDLSTAKVRQGTQFELLKDSGKNKQDAGDALRYLIHTFYF